SDRQAMAILNGQPQTRRVVAVGPRAGTGPRPPHPLGGPALPAGPPAPGRAAPLGRGPGPGGRPGAAALAPPGLAPAPPPAVSALDGVIAGHRLRLHVVGETASLDFGALLAWSTLTTAVRDAQPDRYLVQLRPGSNADEVAAAVQAQEPDFLTVTVSHVGPDSDGNAINTL